METFQTWLSLTDCFFVHLLPVLLELARRWPKSQAWPFNWKRTFLNNSIAQENLWKLWLQCKTWKVCKTLQIFANAPVAPLAFNNFCFQFDFSKTICSSTDRDPNQSLVKEGKFESNKQSRTPKGALKPIHKRKLHITITQTHEQKHSNEWVMRFRMTDEG